MLGADLLSTRLVEGDSASDQIADDDGEQKRECTALEVEHTYQIVV